MLCPNILTYHSKTNGPFSNLTNGLPNPAPGQMNENVQQKGHRNPCEVHVPTHGHVMDEEDKMPHVPLAVVAVVVVDLAVAEGVDMEEEKVVEEVAVAVTVQNYKYPVGGKNFLRVYAG